MRECFDEGVLQSYLDNELSPELAKRVAVHAATCSACAEALTVASDETLLLTNAFEAEMAMDVPTVRLREQIEAAIARTASYKNASTTSGRSLKAWFASFVGQFGLTPQRALGFASVLMLIAFATIFAVLRSGNGPSEVAMGSKIPRGVNIPVVPSSTPPGSRNSNNAPATEGDRNPPQRTKPKKRYDPNTVPEPGQLPKDELARVLPGEKNYLKAIDSLSVEIASSDNTSMKPSLRAEYERNLAVVDQAIASTRRSARRNPNDPDAAAFLYSSYQSKLDLLSAVAEQVRPTIATR